MDLKTINKEAKEKIERAVQNLNSAFSLEMIKILVARDETVVVKWSIFDRPLLETERTITFHYKYGHTKGSFTLEKHDGGRISCYISRQGKVFHIQKETEIALVLSRLQNVIEGEENKQAA